MRLRPPSPAVTESLRFRWMTSGKFESALGKAAISRNWTRMTYGAGSTPFVAWSGLRAGN